jgi:hypothetical protein
MTTRTRLMATSAGIAVAISAFVQAGGLDHSADVTSATAAEVLRDAAERTSMLAERNRSFSAKVGGQIQFRYIFNNASDLPGPEDTTMGFQARRIKINVSGTVIDENWDYAILTGFSRSTGAPALENAYIRRRLNGGWYVIVGQFKLPFLREENISSMRLLAADWSAVHALYTQGFSQGVEVGFGGRGDDVLRFAGAFSDGLQSRNTDFDATRVDHALTARGEYRLAGDWGQFRQFTSFRNSGFAMLIGAAAHWESGGRTAGPFAGTTLDQDVLSTTADVSVLGSGWNALGAAIWRRTDIGGGPEFDDFGLVIQGGMFMTESTEVFGRWDSILADSDRDLDDFHTITVGVNHYMTPESHAAKLTVDVQYLLEATATSLNPGGSALRGMGLVPNDQGSGQWAIRAQFQLLF